MIKFEMMACSRAKAIDMLNTCITTGSLPCGEWLVYPHPMKNGIYICEQFGEKIFTTY